MIELLSAKNTIATAETPNLAQGGVSSSTALNKIHGNIRSDLMNMDLDTQTLLEDVTEIVSIASQQAAALSVAYGILSAELTSITTALATGSDPRTRLTMFAPVFTSDQVTTATVNRKFGQATLPIAGETDWFSTKDMEGNIYIPDQTNLRIALVDSEADYLNLESFQYWEVEGYRNAFDKSDGSVWYYEPPTNTQYVAIWIDAPTDLLLCVSANALELCPFPLLAHDLVDVTLVLNNGNTSSLDLADYSNPGYDSSSGNILSFGNTRFFFPPAQVRAVKLLVKLNAGYDYIGFTDIALKTVHFAKSGILSMDLLRYVSYQAGQGKSRAVPTLVGDIQSYLSTLSPTSASDLTKIVYNLTQLAAGLTPVITAVDIAWT